MPAIVKMLCLSTAHLSRATRTLLDTPCPWTMADDTERHVGEGVYRDDRGHRWLDGGGTALVVIPWEYGWITYAHDDALDEMPDCPDPVYPPDLAAAFRVARYLGCDWIKFDDGSPVLESSFGEHLLSLFEFETGDELAPAKPDE